MDNREERREELREERREERRAERHEHLPNQNAEDILANGKIKHNEHTRKINKLWLWFGVLILIIILVLWLGTLGIFGDLSGYFNGTVAPQQTVNMIMSLFGR